MNTNIYLVRHAHSIYTSDELNRPLSKEGSKNADRITEKVKELSDFYTSILQIYCIFKGRTCFRLL